MSDRLILLDGNNLMHRAYHALPLMDNRPDDARDKPVEGEYTYTNALHGFLMMLFKVMEDWQPRWICAAFDDHGPTFRHKEYDAYKAGRKPTPDELRPQMTAIRELLPELGVKVAHLEGFEADDLMGTLSLKARGMGIQTLIVSGDRDILQLTDDTVNVLYIKQGIRDTILYNPEEIDKKYGIPAPRIADMKGLMGDASDNIPGVACHTGEYSCFHNSLTGKDESAPASSHVLEELFEVIEDRKANPVPGSYTNYLLEKGVEKICKKVGEEASETIIAAVKGSNDEVRYEASDLLYHLMVLIANQGMRPEELYDELRSRRS